MPLSLNTYVITIPVLGNPLSKKSLFQAVCALLNSEGGKIEITKTALDVRAMEQIIIGVIGKATFLAYLDVEEAKSSTAGCKVIVHVKRSKKFVTVNYNLCLPTQKQIATLSMGDDIEIIKHVLERNIVDLEEFVKKDSHITNFVIGKNSGLNESDVVQLKSLKATASNDTTKAITFAKRMVSNKFCHYISGFANNKGGHVYYGIDDKGVVTGEELMANDVREVKDEVTKAITKLIWSENRIQPQKGKHWELYFEKVNNDDGEIMESTYVVVVFIHLWCGGVFTAEPESYYFDEGKVKKIEFALWWESLKRGTFPTNRIIKPSEVDHVTWSSKENMKFFIELSEKLVSHRDEDDLEGFNKLCELAETHKFEKRNASLIVKAGRITIAYKSGNIQVAEFLVKEFEDLLPTSPDRTIFEVRFCLSQSLVARRKKNYLECYNRGKEGLQLGQNIPPGLCLLWLYLECAMNAACVSFKNQHDDKTFQEMKMEALIYLENATKISTFLIQENIPYRLIDFKHKLRIYKAWVLINYSVTGQAAVIAPSMEDLNAAGKELSFVDKMERSMETLTTFRRTEFFLVKSDHFTRLSETREDITAKKSLLQSALDEASAAKALAEKSFNNLLEYAIHRYEMLESKLKQIQDDLSTNRRLEDSEY